MTKWYTVYGVAKYDRTDMSTGSNKMIEIFGSMRDPYALAFVQEFTPLRHTNIHYVPPQTTDT